MENFQDRVEQGLNETRMLMLGAQVLLGFQYQAVFQTGFHRLDLVYQYLDVAALFLLVIAVGLLLVPAQYHQLVEEGQDTPAFDRLLSGILHSAAYPFALALGADLAIASSRLLPSFLAAGIGMLAAATSVLAWYGSARRHRTSTIHHHKRSPMAPSGKMSASMPLKMCTSGYFFCTASISCHCARIRSSFRPFT